MRARAALLGILCASGCSDKGDRFAPIVVDIAANCAEADVEVLLAEMEEGDRPWKRVLSVAVDGPGVDRYWALVESNIEAVPGMRALGLQYIDGTRIGPSSVLWDIAPTVPEASLELRPGPIPGTAWLLQRGPGTFRLWQVDASRGEGIDPVVARSIELGFFPDSNNENLCGLLMPCDVTDWTRELVFLDGRAFVVGLPPFSPNNTTYAFIGIMDSALYPTETIPLEFNRSCDPTDPLAEYTECTEENAATTYPEVAVMGSQRATNGAQHRIFILRRRAIDDVPDSAHEVVFLRLSLDDGHTPEGTIQSKALEDVAPLAVPPSGIARDDFASYMMHPVRDDRAEDGVGAPVITRFSELDDEFDVLQGILLPHDAELLQLESDLALARIVDGAWEVTKLFPDAPERSRVTTYAASSPIVDVAPAGHGAFLLFKEAGGPDLVHLSCADEADEAETTGSTTTD